MKIYVIGVGGVGGYFGARLSEAGNDVCFVARGKTFEVLKSQGLKLKSVKGDCRIPNIKVVESISEIKEPDLIILGIKSWQVQQVAKELKDVVRPTTAVLPLQNGVFASEELAMYLPKSTILGGLCRIISKIESPGVIVHTGVEPHIILGELNNQHTDRIKQIQMCFEKAGVRATIAENIELEIWKKFIAICVGGYIALSRSNIGELMELTESRKLICDLLSEIHKLANYIGVPVEHSYIEASMRFLDSMPYDSNYSMARDIWDGKPSELDCQNGAVVKIGKQHGFDTPINELIYYALLPQEKRNRKNKP